MVSVNVDGKDYQLNEQQVNAMVFVQEAKAIHEGDVILFLFRLRLPLSIKKPSSSS